MPFEPEPVVWLDVLAGSHDRLADLASDLGADALGTAPTAPAGRWRTFCRTRR